MKKHLSILILADIITVLLTGCAGGPCQTYPGPSLPKEKVAFIKPTNAIGAQMLTGIYACDGVNLKGSAGGITVLPGKHTIGFNAIAIVTVSGPLGMPASGFEAIGSCNQDVSVDAGCEYSASGTWIPSGPLPAGPISEPGYLPTAGGYVPGYLSVTVNKTK